MYIQITPSLSWTLLVLWDQGLYVVFYSNQSYVLRASIVCHLLLPMIKIFNKTEDAILPMQTMPVRIIYFCLRLMYTVETHTLLLSEFEEVAFAENITTRILKALNYYGRIVIRYHTVSYLRTRLTFISLCSHIT